MRCVVVTGSRSWPEDNPGPIENAIRGAEALIVGDATGVDAIALRLALEWDVIPNVFAASRKRYNELVDMREKTGKPMTLVLAADWEVDAKKAGPKRNGAMVQRAVVERDDGMEVLCAAFPLPDSTGTIDCMRQMRRAGFSVNPWVSSLVGDNLTLF